MRGETFRPNPEQLSGEEQLKNQETKKEALPPGFEIITETDLLPGTTLTIAKRDFGDRSKAAEGTEEKITIVENSHLKEKDFPQDPDIVAYKNETGKIVYGSKRELLRGAWVKKPMEETEKYLKAA